MFDEMDTTCCYAKQEMIWEELDASVKEFDEALDGA